MRIEIVINSGVQKEHCEISEMFAKVFREKEYEVIIVDLGGALPEHEKCQMIKQGQPHLIVTLDMAGFELRNTLEFATYNVMPYRMAHIMPGEYAKYEKWLHESMNFSMFFYARSKTAEYIRENHPEIENVYPVEAFSVSRWWDDDKQVCELINKIVNDTEIELDY